MQIQKELRKILAEIESDCLPLKRKGQLTEYGQGQLDLIRLLKAAGKENQKE